MRIHTSCLSRLLIVVFTLSTVHGAVADSTPPPQTNNHRYWAQAQVSASFLDTKTDTPVIGTSLGTQFGMRFGSFGFFLNTEFVRSATDSTVYPSVEYLQVGPGLEWLLNEYNLRSSVSSGWTRLTSDAGTGRQGDTGWYLDFRPVSVRFPQKSGGVIEFSPLTIDISIPTSDSALARYGHYVNLSYEWATR